MTHNVNGVSNPKMVLLVMVLHMWFPGTLLVERRLTHEQRFLRRRLGEMDKQRRRGGWVAAKMPLIVR
jgi:hypothetical protein